MSRCAKNLIFRYFLNSNYSDNSIRQGVQFLGFPLFNSQGSNKYKAENWQECLKVCKRLPRCKYFNFWADRKDCMVKTGMGKRVTGERVYFGHRDLCTNSSCIFDTSFQNDQTKVVKSFANKTPVGGYVLVIVSSVIWCISVLAILVFFFFLKRKAKTQKTKSNYRKDNKDMDKQTYEYEDLHYENYKEREESTPSSKAFHNF